MIGKTCEILEGGFKNDKLNGFGLVLRSSGFYGIGMWKDHVLNGYGARHHYI
jgi:hypothetical protein